MGRRDNGGIAGSGVFGLFGSTVHCDANNTSLYCTTIKLFNILVILFVLYFLYKAFAGKK
jgi:hypothetical protein